MLTFSRPLLVASLRAVPALLFARWISAGLPLRIPAPWQ
jgi:hypothetical protein